MIWVNALAIAVHLLFGVWILRRFKEYTVLFGYLFFLQTWSLLSCFYNDFGIFNFELFRYTETTLATTRLALFLVVFNFGFAVVAKVVAKRPLVRRDYLAKGGDLRLGNFKLTAYLAALLSMLYIVYSFVTGGVPLLEGIDKVLFFKSAGPVERFLLGYGFLIAFILGYYRRLRGRFSVNGLLLAAMLVYLLLTGNKFSALIKLIVAYYSAVHIQVLLNNPKFTIFSRRYALWGVVGIVFVLSVAFGSYLYWGEDAAGATQLLTNRVLALQGHLWWVSDYRIFALDAFDGRHWLAEWQGIVHFGAVAEGSVGMKYVMLQAIGPDKAYAIFDIGYLYTMAYPAILILTVPWPFALLIQLCAGALFGLLLYYFYYCLLYRHVWRAIIAVLIIVPYLGVLSTGDLYNFISPGIACKMLILLALEIGTPLKADCGASVADIQSEVQS